MLVLDNNLLSDYLAGKPAAESFLREYEPDPWAVSGIVAYEAYMGCLHGYIDGDVSTVRQAIGSSMDVLDVTERTAAEAVELQRELLDRGVPADHPDALIAASAREHGGTFGTAEKQFHRDDVREVLSVAAYDPD
ncbi:PIN domain-containing protein [Halostella salina]|uniref:PIN domain-containing protein n=1 Tax=Halostella salina TaxID=1547897 RepID=UPI000EF7D1DE|nr:PIN domain-containing protein [Halostella salina]